MTKKKKGGRGCNWTWKKNGGTKTEVRNKMDWYRDKREREREGLLGMRGIEI